MFALGQIEREMSSGHAAWVPPRLAPSEYSGATSERPICSLRRRPHPAPSPERHDSPAVCTAHSPSNPLCGILRLRVPEPSAARLRKWGREDRPPTKPPCTWRMTAHLPAFYRASSPESIVMDEAAFVSRASAQEGGHLHEPRADTPLIADNRVQGCHPERAPARAIRSPNPHHADLRLLP